MDQRLNKQRPHPAARDLGELDAIVVNIFDSLQGGVGDRAAAAPARSPQATVPRPRPSGSMRPSAAPREEAVERAEDSPPPSNDAAVDPAPVPRDAPRSEDAPSPGPARPLAACASPAGRAFAGTAQPEDPDFLLSEEEEKFVEETVAWLSARCNPDILLDRIWNRLIDLTEEQEAGLHRDADAAEPLAGPEDEGDL